MIYNIYPYNDSMTGQTVFYLLRWGSNKACDDFEMKPLRYVFSWPEGALDTVGAPNVSFRLIKAILLRLYVDQPHYEALAVKESDTESFYDRVKALDGRWDEVVHNNDRSRLKAARLGDLWEVTGMCKKLKAAAKQVKRETKKAGQAYAAAVEREKAATLAPPAPGSTDEMIDYLGNERDARAAASRARTAESAAMLADAEEKTRMVYERLAVQKAAAQAAARVQAPANTSADASADASAADLDHVSIQLNDRVSVTGRVDWIVQEAGEPELSYRLVFDEAVPPNSVWFRESLVTKPACI